MREAHEIGLPSSATMMYGHVESDSDATELVSSLQKNWWIYGIHPVQDPGAGIGGLNLLR